jgi:hypothetical protein
VVDSGIVRAGWHFLNMPLAVEPFEKTGSNIVPLEKDKCIIAL